MTPAVEVVGATFAYGGRRAVDGISFTVGAGESFGVMGPNGSGKSTLFGLLATRLTPQAGAVRVMGADVATRPDAVRGLIGVVPQGATLDRFLTVAENLEVWARLHGMPATAIPGAVTEALLAAGITDRRRDRAGALSGGLARRAELARALLHRPAVLLLDEPTAALDPAARAEWRDRLDGLRRDRQLTVVSMTHDLDEAGRCDRVAVLADGRIAGAGTPAELCEAVGAPVVTVRSGGDPAALAAALAAALGVQAKVVDGLVRFTHAQAHAMVARVAEVAGADALAVTVSRPSLGEAFVSLTGTGWEDRR